MTAGETALHEVAPNHIRHDLTHLNERDIQSLKAALKDLQADTSNDGYQVSYHSNTGKSSEGAVWTVFTVCMSECLHWRLNCLLADAIYCPLWGCYEGQNTLNLA